MKILLCLLVLSFGAISCESGKTPGQIQAEMRQARAEREAEMEFRAAWRKKVLECVHDFKEVGSCATRSKIMCPKCGIEQRDLPRL